MFALQTSPLSVSLSLTVLGGLCVVGVLLGTAGSVVIRRLSNPVGKYRYLYTGVIVPLAILTLATLIALDFGRAVVTILPVRQTSLAGSALGYFVESGGACLVGLATYAPTVRGVRAVRDIDLSTGRSVAKLTRWALGISALYAGIRITLQFGWSTSPILGLVVIAGLLIGLLFASPWIVPLTNQTRVPADKMADRIDSLTERAGLSIRDTRVLVTDNEETAIATVRGLPRYRRLFVSTTFLGTFDDDTATTLLAIEAGRVQTHRLPKLAGGLLLSLIPALVGLYGGGGGLMIASSLMLLLGTLWISRRTIYAADAYAAQTVGREAVADALTRYASVHKTDVKQREIPNPFSPSVRLGDRIERLREE